MFAGLVEVGVCLRELELESFSGVFWRWVAVRQHVSSVLGYYSGLDKDVDFISSFIWSVGVWWKRMSVSGGK